MSSTMMANVPKQIRTIFFLFFFLEFDLPIFFNLSFFGFFCYIVTLSIQQKEVLILKKTILLSLSLGVLLSSGFLISNAIATSNISQEKSESAISKEQALTFFTKVLEQQKADFLNNTPLTHTNQSRLSSRDEAVLIFLSSTKVDKQQLHSFSYKISNVKVYSENQRNYAEAYVTRTFKFGSGLETGLGDTLVLEIQSSPDDLKGSSHTISSSKSTSEVNEKISVDEFLEQYEAEATK